MARFNTVVRQVSFLGSVSSGRGHESPTVIPVPGLVASSTTSRTTRLGGLPGTLGTWLASVALAGSILSAHSEAQSDDRWGSGACTPAADGEPGLLAAAFAGDGQGWLSAAGFEVGGFVDQGFTWNPDSPRNRSNGNLLYNDRANEYQMNALYGVIEREVVTGCEWDIGGRLDLLFGTAGQFLGSPGLELHDDFTDRWNSEDRRFYKFVAPQFYADVNVPVANGVKVRAGRFYSPLGPQIVNENDLYFYSFGTLESFSIPYTFTGVLLESSLTDQITVQGAVTRGLDRFEDNNDDLGALFTVAWNSCDEKTRLTFGLHTGDEDNAGQDNITIYALTLAHELSNNLHLQLLHTLGYADNAAIGSLGQRSDAEWYGIGGTLSYTISETLAASVRMEWYRDDDHATYVTPLLGLPNDLVDGGDFYSLTVGLRWFLAENIIVRPEIRYDWSDVSAPLLGIGGIYDDLGEKQQWTMGTGILITF